VSMEVIFMLFLQRSSTKRQPRKANAISSQKCPKSPKLCK
jgi:hypothetical protein